ncbi:hypothetical protein ACFYOY_13155 [Streptomyces sp. NPDC007875]|uniref:hypothetical protein n=1 Tax=Streptomyces sp. NPDC007875 TaxID=3364783 RepID=UPI0036967A2F
MTSSIADLADAIRLQAVTAGAAEPAVRGADWQTATVTAVGTGTVDCGAITARRLESYQSPAVGDRIVIVQSGNGNWLAAGRTSSGGDTSWTVPTLGTGYTQGDSTTTGNNHGPIRYRKIMWAGTWYMQWDGGADRATGAQVTNVLSTALAVDYRPVNRASFVIARNATSISGVSNTTSVVHSLKADFQQDGTVALVSAAAGSQETAWLSFKGITYPLT